MSHCHCQVAYLKKKYKRQCTKAEKPKGIYIAESSYSSTKCMVAHCWGIEPVMRLRLRSLFQSARQS